MLRWEYYAMLVVAVTHLLKVVADAETSNNDKWPLIATVFPTYQLWRGAYGSHESAVEVCDGYGDHSGAGSLLAVSETDLQQCYEDMRRQNTANSIDYLGVGHVIGKLTSGVLLLFMAVHLATHRFNIPSTQSWSPTADRQCWRAISNLPYYALSTECPTTDLSATQHTSWEKCQELCGADIKCRQTKLVAYNQHSRICAFGYTTAACYPGDGFVFYQSLPCTTNRIKSCGELYNLVHAEGAFDNGIPVGSRNCNANQLGAVCDISCDVGYTPGEWGSVAMCGATSDGSLEWKPATFDSRTFDNARQHMCKPDASRRNGLLFHALSQHYISGIAQDTAERSTKPLLKAIASDVNSVEFSSTSVYESVGPKLDGSSHVPFTTLQFPPPAAATHHYLHATLNVDRIYQQKSLAMFIVLDPLEASDWFSFTNLFSLQNAMFADSSSSGASFVSQKSALLPDTAERRLVVVSLIAIGDAATDQITVRINGHPLHPNGYRTLTRNCGFKFTQPYDNSCTNSWDPATENIQKIHGPCASSELFCEETAISYAVAKSTSPRTFLGAAVTGETDQPTLNPFRGWIAEAMVHDTKMDVRIDDSNNLRRIEEIEWLLATKYRLRQAFAPSKPSKPNLRRISQMGIVGIEITFPEQGTIFSEPSLSVQQYDESTTTWANIMTVSNTANIVFLPNAIPGKTYTLRLAVKGRAQDGNEKIVPGFEASIVA